MFLFVFVELRERRRQSQSVQRDMPRPSDVNASVLRPVNVDPPLTGLQKVLINIEFLFAAKYIVEFLITFGTFLG